MKIAFAGNPNSGKTTMFNALTGSNEKVGNWAGVTVDKKEQRIKKSLYAGTEELTAVDLPGTYSMSPFTSEENITKVYIENEKPDVIINIVDATNLSRSLFFTTQLMELGVPVVVALNKSDINVKKKTKINKKLLTEALGCPVIETVSTSFRETGLKELVAAAMTVAGTVQKAPYRQGEINVADKAEVLEADKKRYLFVNDIVSKVETRKVFTKEKNLQDKFDAILTHRYAGIPIFAVIMFLVFQISQAWVGPFVADTLGVWLEKFQTWVGGYFVDANPLLYSLLIDGVIGGVTAVIGFLPLVMVMYFLIALLEDCGYMARATVVLDPIFKKVGLSGKSVIPFVMTIGCAVPGIMASRTIHNERERRATAMLAPFMPCGAKVPLISLFAGLFFSEHQGIISFTVYFTGIVLIFLGALLVNKITGSNGKKSYFIIELPEYKVPSFWRAFVSMCGRGWEYIVKAATIILICNTVVQVMQTFTWSFTVADGPDASILASVASPFAYVLVPVVGVFSWQLAAAAVTGFIAKENVVGTLAVCFVGLENLIDAEEFALIEGAGAEAASVLAITKVAGLAYLMFNLYSPPCFAAIGAMNAEMKSAKWLWASIALQFGVGFSIACLVYQFGTLFTTGSFGAGFVPGMLAIAGFVAVVVAMSMKSDRSLAKESAVK